MSAELTAMSACDLARAIAGRDVSSREVIEAHLARIAQVNPRINALTQVFAEQALAQADAADRAIAAAAVTGPLHGVPITVKENIDVAGSATTKGVASLRDAFASRDAPVVAHLKRAGAIVLARSNMPEYGMRWHTDNQLHGATQNPWSAAHTPGGSSGGEAAAIATGMSALGIGNDMGGSTRQPAINCGVCGLRPSTGRVSRIMTMADDAPMYYEQIACVNGPLARRVDDLQLALSVMQREDPTDPIWRQATAPAATDADHRVALIAQLPGEATAAAVATALRRAADWLTEAGYSVDEIDAPMLQRADWCIQQLAEFEAADYIDELLPQISNDSGTFLRAVLSDSPVSGADYRHAIAERHRVAARWNLLLRQYPLVLGPVSTMEPFRVGADTGARADIRRLMQSFRLTELCNLLGLAALALPVAIENDLPQGVQLIARRFDEARCFAAARIIERASPVTTPIDPRD